MKAQILTAHARIEQSPLRLVEVPKPIPMAHELLVKVLACGGCRTDLHVIEGDLASGVLPIIPGHQVVGVIDDQGPGCHRFHLGQRVGIAWLGSTCGQCRECYSSRENLCQMSRYTGYQLPGGYAEYTTVLEDYAYAIPDGFSDAAATPLLCAGIVGYRALKRSALPKGGQLGIYGFGSSAHVVIQIARHLGCEVFVATRNKTHQEFAKQLGATWAGPADSLLPSPVDSVIVFAPVGMLVPLALQSLRPGGTVSLAGIHMSDIPSLPYDSCLFHEKNLVSVEANTRVDGQEFLALAAQIPIRPQVTVYPLSDANRMLQDMKANAIQGTAVLIP